MQWKRPLGPLKAHEGGSEQGQPSGRTNRSQLDFFVEGTLTFEFHVQTHVGGRSTHETELKPREEKRTKVSNYVKEAVVVLSISARFWIVQSMHGSLTLLFGAHAW